ncbi:uncharacterized protein LOC110185907 [Drosophila serrata]|uniref:uncharacterized protein LOC110185907 n=1 Tax=Drosophila serrata TaxID=7274 RepID=UPI000A1CF728|nr:uncharacterized protein LOC110185907 [Drosophila serrata]
MTNIASLNDDCLLQIIEYLSLEEQLELWQATKSTSRLCSVVLYAWQRQSKYCISRQTFAGRPHLQQNFLQCINSTVVELTLCHLPIEQLERWKDHSFPNVRELYYLGDLYDEADSDADIAILVNCFPQLESIGISGHTSGQYISQWQHLRRVDLQLCWYLDSQCFKGICQKLRLQTLCVQWRRFEADTYIPAISSLRELEELDLDIVNLSTENARKLLSLPKLKKLRLQMMDLFDDVLEVIGQLRGQDLVAITCRDNIISWRPQVLATLDNLRRLTLIDDGGLYDIDLSVIIKSFPRLEQLHFEHSLLWPNADGIWEVVAACPQLKLITIFNPDLPNEFLFLVLLLCSGF